MNEEKDRKPAQGSSTTVAGKLPKLSAENLKRLSVYVVQGSDVLLQSPVSANGSFQFRLTGIVIDPCIFVLLGPKGLDARTLLAKTELPRVSLESAKSSKGVTARESKSGVLNVDFSNANINDKLVELWWLWCRAYTVSGTLQTANGCPIPGADVTVYNVVSGVGGPVKNPIETVQTDANGNWTATFNWCECFCCWPCWPIWWRCWPWWWEWDILAAIENVERQIALKPAHGLATQLGGVAPLKRPAGADLMTGQGFARANTVLKQDASRTSRIAAKFANPQIRELFPWWWWCCENPNLVFSATQNGNIILDEDPATSTRWCFASGQTVPLVGNSLSLGVCPPPIVCEGFAWTSVGNPGTLVTQISNGYARGTPGTDVADMAFAGNLNLYGGFSDLSIPFYQVWAGLWGGNGNPARGGTPPATAAPLSLGLSATVVIARKTGLGYTFEYDSVSLGPCSFMGIDNLYMTTSQRMNPPAGVTGLGSTPVLNPGDFVVTWADAGRIIGAIASAFIGGAIGGGVDLTAVAYDSAGNELFLVNNNPLTLMIDSSGLSAARIDSLSAFDVNGNSVPLTGSSTVQCPAYHIGPKGYLLLHVTVTDNDPSSSMSLNEHLYAYEIDTQFGHGSTSVPTAPAHRGYGQAPGTFTPPSAGQLYGIDGGYGAPDTALVSFVGGGDTIQISPQVSCCYDFQLWAGKRTTDGETYFCTWGNYDFQTATIDVS